MKETPRGIMYGGQSLPLPLKGIQLIQRSSPHREDYVGRRGLVRGTRRRDAPAPGRPGPAAGRRQKTRVGLHSSHKKRDGSGTSREVTSSAPPEAEYQNIHTLRTADLIRQRQGDEKSTLRSSYIIRNGDNFILVERRRRRRRRSGARASSTGRHHTPPPEDAPRAEQKRRPPARLKIFGIQWPLHSSDSR
ncbi:hypothetical protein EVAR_63399_1 [Eumeta japonica]|uniref:Uncharacterized protein n=1 Tax=Eumeta variegata TaxID=151549 RepID=A0A4C1Z3B4_EUMVA|nr:hypothetical protein EVAR_63399_1 [Eumeta japonica]